MIEIVKYDNKYIEQVLEIAQEIHAASLYTNIDMDKEKLISQLNLASHMSPQTYFRLAVQNDVVYGAFLGIISPTFFCSDLIAKDMGWWIKPKFRGSRAAIKLLRDFEAWAKISGAVKVMIGQTGVHDIDKTRKLFEHCGYTVVGYNTAKDLR